MVVDIVIREEEVVAVGFAVGVGNRIEAECPLSANVLESLVIEADLDPWLIHRPRLKVRPSLRGLGTCHIYASPLHHVSRLHMRSNPVLRH